MIAFASVSSVFRWLIAPGRLLVADLRAGAEREGVRALDERERGLGLRERRRIVRSPGTRARPRSRPTRGRRSRTGRTGACTAPDRSVQLAESAASHRRDARVGRRLPAQLERVGERVGAPVAVGLGAARPRRTRSSGRRRRSRRRAGVASAASPGGRRRSLRAGAPALAEDAGSATGSRGGLDASARRAAGARAPPARPERRQPTGAFAARPPEVTATISAAIASAICAGERPPRSRPAGPWIRSRSASEKPCSASAARRRSWVRFAPIAPT